ncbi:hypothetical protein PRIPAC_95870 [Pristionchus pacificus]|uniref:GOST seven transmembrane domain-containing protein n=1 Tax=Pristionchus pacificus TaxID=54126 RepID=A0A2A6B368_PRIPA|nr:hypothetical protein PRIPAC_95870 [Pristionchus pacificus]|eukprot:PDM60325.1 hypothetical protein PRIPAC_54150 [Pristionchus pacificus]
MARILLLAAALASISVANLLLLGKSHELVEMDETKYQLIGFPQSALNETEVEIRFTCETEMPFEFDVQFVLRSSPCDREFFDARSNARVRDRLQFYFENENEIPREYHYETMVFYKSEIVRFNCRDLGSNPFVEAKGGPMILKNVTTSKNARRKRAPPLGLNGQSIDGGAKMSLSSWHPVQKVPVDAIYFLVIKVTTASTDDHKRENLTVTVEWRQPHGYLSAIDYPLHRFYFLMCIFYAVLAGVWLYMSIRYYRDILRVQYWIGVVIIFGMVEKAVFYSEYQGMNQTGESTDGLIQLAEIVSCAKRTMARVLIIIVSVGYGVVKPRLGETLSKVSIVGVIYFTFCAIEGLARVSKNHVEAAKQKQFAALPLVIVEMSIFYWIFTSLVGTMRTLKLRRNEVKLTVYRHFMNTLIFAVVGSVIFMVWSLYEHIFPICLQDWKELWIDTAFWHILFCTILVAIMILWRPSANNQRYAFTPLLDDSEDEMDDEIFNNSQVAGFEAISLRNTEGMVEQRNQRENAVKEAKLQADLKWIEDNIPTSLTDHLLMDEEEDRDARELEMNKML